MDRVRGRITHLSIYQEEGGRDWAMNVSKLIWCGMSLLFPVALFRLLNDLFGLLLAVCGILLLAVLFRLFGSFNLVMLDEVLSRIFTTMRSAIRLGIVRIHDFRLLTDEGREVACILKGDLVGAGPVEGDMFELEGTNKQGAFWIRSGINQVTGSLLAGRSIRWGWLLFVTVALITILLFYLAGTFDQLIYTLIEKFILDEG